MTKAYLLSMGAGLLAGLLYSLLGIRSPAPPAIALVGLLGILIGEQILPVAKRLPVITRLTAGAEPAPHADEEGSPRP